MPNYNWEEWNQSGHIKKVLGLYVLYKVNQTFFLYFGIIAIMSEGTFNMLLLETIFQLFVYKTCYAV